MKQITEHRIEIVKGEIKYIIFDIFNVYIFLENGMLLRFNTSGSANVMDNKKVFQKILKEISETKITDEDLYFHPERKGAQYAKRERK